MSNCGEKMGGENFLEESCACGLPEGHDGEHTVCIHGHTYVKPAPPALQNVDGVPTLTRPQQGERPSGWLP